ncbi:hypothetical protein BC937DRAFT_86203 [Endogone sp. FLAS-F59071]|nr:hypothetical protein BC937DRAFT_86203 [Endogone sp. FLAS-F59071]|eukprot:RUS20182.1 hypothetical protein BC937DRAFT_86203 [Endogone sp. FLAS-F59071]
METFSLTAPVYSKLAYPSPDTGLLVYPPYNEQHDRLPDFSYAGYNHGLNDIPSDIPVAAFLQPNPDPSTDDTLRIQQLLDHISTLPLDPVTRLRGALQLSRGDFRVSGTINIYSSGVVLQGDPKGGTHVLVTVNPRQSTHLINLEGKPHELVAGTRAVIADDYVSVGSSQVRVTRPDLFCPGDRVIVIVNFNEAWIQKIEMHNIPSKGNTSENMRWKPGRFESFRIVRAVDPVTGSITLDVPLTLSISKQWGGGSVQKYTSRRLECVGVQNLAFELPFNKDRTPDDIMRNEGPTGKKDYRFAGEMFKNYLIRMEDVEDGWVRRVTSKWFRNFLRVQSGVVSTTIEDCHHLFPPPVKPPQRVPYFCGQSAYELGGQLVLLNRCHADHSMHSYVYMARITGPNVIHACTASNRMADAGPHMKWCE